MRWIVGLPLITAAVLKAAELYLYPANVLAGGVFSLEWNRFLLPLLVGGEFGLGLAVLLGVYRQQLRGIVAVLFAGFACYSLFLALRGAASCGCFGAVAISPWWTLLLDVSVLSGLLLEGKANLDTNPVVDTDQAALPRKPELLIGSIAIFSFCIALGLIPQETSSTGSLQTVYNLTILEPEAWVGQVFPLSNLIDVDISSGKWIVLLHRHDCPKCQEAIPKYEYLAGSSSEPRIAVIEVPPFTVAQKQAEHCLSGRLTDDREWFVQTPVEIRLDDGIVSQASLDLPAISNQFKVASRDAPALSNQANIILHNDVSIKMAKGLR